ncbi:hypothetical protein DVH24_009282 [Malus domestica]|uniref:TIR domain-containing protein n=1 Tax=Malus domestica TaxID=3750 RepID=A0A498IVV7_MALDO|nr:hypothetical protein DVH24_009282 [Malus domestica]
MPTFQPISPTLPTPISSIPNATPCPTPTPLPSPIPISATPISPPSHLPAKTLPTPPVPSANPTPSSFNPPANNSPLDPLVSLHPATAITVCNTRLQQLFSSMALTLSTNRASASFLFNESAPRWKYDVFLSFRGVDTRKGFVSHLHHELSKCQGITTFMDDRELQGGTSIHLELPSAIKESHIAIVVLSPNYASSKWCLDELTTILQCMEARNSVLPVFYQTDPSDVGNQRGCFAEAFAEHEEKLISIEGKKKVLQWKADLKRVSKICGWTSKESKCESELIQKIVKSVWRKGTRAIEAISLRLLKVEEVRQWNCEAFSKMDGLSFRPHLLAKLEMRDSNLVRLWEGKMDLPNLKHIDISNSYKLKSISDFSGIPNLERLILRDCKNLVEIHPSIAILKRLKHLLLNGCESINSLPSEVEMDSLETFDLNGCSNVKKIPEFGEQMKNVLRIHLDGTAIEKIPSSIGHLVGLKELHVRNCKNLLNLPRAICNLKSLRYLSASGCSKIDQLPGDMDHLEALCWGPTMTEPLVSMKNLKRLVFKTNSDIAACGSDGKARDGWGLRRLFGLEKSHPDPPPCWRLVLSSLNHLCSLTELSLENCNLREGDIPDDIGCLSLLGVLYLSRNNFVSLPESFRRLSKLFSLDLEGCISLQKLPPLPSNRGLRVNLDNCTSLRRLSGPSSFYGDYVTCRNCIALVQDEDLINRILIFVIEGLKVVIPGSEIPEWFSNQSAGHSINVELPPPSCTNWLGIAFCVVFQDPKQNLANPAALCHYDRFEIWYSDAHFSHRVLINRIGSVASEHLWVFYLRRYRNQRREDCLQEQCLFETYFFDIEGQLKADLNMVKKCGARLVYEQDLKELNQKLLKRTREYRDKAAPSGPGTSGYLGNALRHGGCSVSPDLKDEEKRRSLRERKRMERASFMITQRASTSCVLNESAPRWKYDVLLSFRGVDTRKGFVSHLYHELCNCQGITTFMDDRELEGGTSIPSELPRAIEESQIAIVVLSPDYASSKWCLKELTTILKRMEARNSILPVFYETDPSDVGNQKGSFAKAFDEHEEKFISTEDKMKVTQWREALKKVSKISGWHSKESKSESEIIQQLVKSVWKKVQATFPLLDPSQELSTSDFSGIPNLERLILLDCKNLVEIHPSIAILKRLKHLLLNGCESINSLLSEVEMDSLETFDLDGCSNVKKIPEFGEQMKNVLRIHLDGTAIEKIPSSIGHLVGLRELHVRNCKNLLNLPRAICNLKSLGYLSASGCSKIDKLPGDMDHLEALCWGPTMTEPLVSMKNLKRLLFKTNSNIAACGSNGKARDGWVLCRLFGLEKSRPDLPSCWGSVLSSLNRLCSLTELSLENCNLREGDIPDDIGCLSLLGVLYLSRNNFVSLPESFRRLSKLFSLDLEGCKSLQKLPPLPSNRGLRVNLDNCTSLRRLSGPSNFYGDYVTCRNCIALVQDEDLINKILKFVIQGLKVVIPGSEIPEWFSNQCVGHSINVELPPPSCTNWLGIAFCVVFQDPKQNLANPATLRHYDRFEIWYSDAHFSHRVLINRIGSAVSEHLWVFYLRRYRNQHREDCLQEQCLFETYFFDIEGQLKADLNMVKKCGARLVYEQDLKELNQKLLKRTREYRDKAAPSGPGSVSFNDAETICKRRCN